MLKYRLNGHKGSSLQNSSGLRVARALAMRAFCRWQASWTRRSVACVLILFPPGEGGAPAIIVEGSGEVVDVGGAIVLGTIVSVMKV